MIPLDSFMAHSADGRLVPVVPRGQSISLTFSNRTEYVERALDYRLHEMDSQVRRSMFQFQFGFEIVWGQYVKTPQIQFYIFPKELLSLLSFKTPGIDWKIVHNLNKINSP